MTTVWLLTFWAMQTIAQVVFKYGSDAPERWLTCFIIGNVFGASSIWLLMLLYRDWDPNIALGLGTGGGFLCAQGALAMLFHTQISGVQWIGAIAVAAGMALFSIGTKA